MKKHIATAASWAKPLLGWLPFTRVGTRYLYTEKEIDEYVSLCADYGLNPYLRRSGRKPDPDILRQESPDAPAEIKNGIICARFYNLKAQNWPPKNVR